VRTPKSSSPAGERIGPRSVLAKIAAMVSATRSSSVSRVTSQTVRQRWARSDMPLDCWALSAAVAAAQSSGVAGRPKQRRVPLAVPSSQASTTRAASTAGAVAPYRFSTVSPSFAPKKREA